jgi:hypothetical protein
MTDEQLQQIANDLIAQYKDEIIDQGDWWWGTDTHSFNIHSPDEDGWFHINIYPTIDGEDNYSKSINLPHVYLGAPETNGAIRMRDDLAKAGYAVPASKTFSDYDTLDDRLYVTAKELEGATFGNDPRTAEDHPFCYVQLKDGRSLYFISVDLDFEVEA